MGVQFNYSFLAGTTFPSSTLGGLYFVSGEIWLKYLKNITVTYRNRYERVEFAAKLLKQYNLENESILNVGGGGRRHLNTALEKLKIIVETFFKIVSKLFLESNIFLKISENSHKYL